MLKIKDNVDLKELEKFGFEYCKNSSSNWYAYKSAMIIENRVIYHYNTIVGDCVLFDLIQAGLVEKVADDKG